MQRNTELERVAGIFVGDWVITITNQWWLEDPTTVTSGTASCQWLGDSFLRLQAEFDGEPTWEFVFGRSDARDQFVVLYGDERGVLRVFDLTIEDGSWEMSRTDPDFHQRLVGRIDGIRISARPMPQMIGEAPGARTSTSSSNGPSPEPSWLVLVHFHGIESYHHSSCV